MHAVEPFLERFAAFGAAPAVASYLPLFHPDATLFDAGMAAPLGVAEIPEHLEAILKAVPDFRMVPERWRARGGTVFVEARNEATVGPGPFQWRSIYCVDLEEGEGGRVVRGRRYYDRRALFARLSPEVPRLPETAPAASEVAGAPGRFDDPEALVRAFGRAFEGDDAAGLARLFREDGTLHGPDVARPLARGELAHHHRALAFLLADRRMELLTWAGDASLAFAEWRLHGSLGGEPIVLPIADRFDLAGGAILAARAYFDTLDLAGRLAGAEALA